MLLLLLSFLCLGSWANTLKSAGAGWRFELYYFDFALGSMLLAFGAAWTLGVFGSELSFVDRIAVAGLRSQALALSGGFLFSLGNILLLATVALLGLSVAFPLVFSIALIVWAVVNAGGSNPLLLTAGLLLLSGAAILATMVRREPMARAVPSSSRRTNVPAPVRKSTKGIVTGVLGGVFIGGSYPLAEAAFWGDLGLGAYAGLLVFCIGVVVSTALFNLFFLNMAIDGPRLALPAYLKGNLRQHTAGILGGALWSCGLLASLLARSVPAGEQPTYSSVLLLTEGSALLAVLWGLGVWREWQGIGGDRKKLLAGAALLYLAGLVALAFRFRHLGS